MKLVLYCFHNRVNLLLEKLEQRLRGQVLDPILELDLALSTQDLSHRRVVVLELSRWLSVV